MYAALASAGPAIGGIGLYLDSPITFWLGGVIAGLNLFMNLASGAMRFPILPLVAIAIGAVAWSPWHVGVAIGLLVYTAIEALGDLWSMIVGRRV